MTAEIVELGIRVQQKELKEAESQFDKTGKAAERAEGNFGRVGKASDRMNKDLAGLTSQLKHLLAAFISFEAIRRGLSFIIKFNDEVAKLKGQLVVVTGSVQGAASAFEALNKWSDKTPFEIDDVVASFVRLRMAGIKPTEDMMNDLGNIASTLRKPLNEVVNSVAAATMGNARGLRQMGIQVEEYNGKLIATFGGQSKIIKNNAKAIVDYIQEISKAKFAGGMEAQMETLSTQLKMLHDRFEDFALTVGEAGLNAALIEFVKFIREGTEESGNFAESLGKGLASAIRTVIEVLRFLRDNMDIIKTLIATLMAYKLALWVLGVAAAFKQLNTIMKANVFGIAIAGIAGIITYFGGMKKVILDLTALWLTFVAEINKAGNKFTAFKINRKTAQLERVDVSGANNDIDEELYKKLMELKKQWDAAGTPATPKSLGDINKELGIGNLPGDPTSSSDMNAMKDAESKNKIIEQYLDKLKQERDLVMETADERERMQAIYELENALKEKGYTLDKATREEVEQIVKQRQELTKMMESITDLTDKMKEGVRNTFKTMFKDGIGGMDDMLDSWADMFYDWAADTMSKNFFDPIFDALSQGLAESLGGGGGGFFGDLLGGIGGLFGFGGGGGGGADEFIDDDMFGFGDMFAFADGGDFTVGGVGGVDSQTVQFRATPGESVSVGRGGKQTPVVVQVNVHNNGNGKASVQEQDTPDGKSIDVTFDEMQAKNIRKYGSQSNRAIRETFLLNPTTGTR